MAIALPAALEAAADKQARLARLAGVRALLARRGVLVSPPAVPEAEDDGLARTPPDPGALPTGDASLDALLPGGFPRRAVSEVLGSAACGKTSLVLPALARVTRAGGWVAFVDPAAEAYPPAMADAGLVLARTLYVRPPAPSGDPAAALWAAEVLLHGGAFDAVVLDAGALVIARRQSNERKAVVLRAAAEASAAAFIVLGEEPLGAPPALRLRVEARPPREGGGEVRRVCVILEKSRYGRCGASVDLFIQTFAS